ncbi:MAG: tRNA (adenosine(37)-N6)-threonylcarbamoyltransferase complex dimerization subunit type 1 TsaB [Caldilineaceae bacterium]
MLLALDTATQTASLALYDLDADLLLAEWSWQARRRQTQDLLATAQLMLKQFAASPQQISALAVTTGPGSFTGVRIAISAVKGMGLGLPAPPRVVGIPTLCVTAAPWLWPVESSDPPGCTTVCAYIQAGRGRYNWLFFIPGSARASRLYKPTADEHAAGPVAEFAAALATAGDQHPIWLVGEPTAELRAAVAHLPHVALVDGASSLRRAGNLAHLAALHLAHGQTDELAALQPLYLRAP